MRIFKDINEEIRFQLRDLKTGKMLIDFSIEDDKELYKELKEHIISNLNEFDGSKTEEFELNDAIQKITATKDGLAITMKFIFPIYHTDTRALRDYNLKLNISNK